MSTKRKPQQQQQRLDARNAALEKKRKRTELGEELLDIFLTKLIDKLKSNSCRSQDLLVALHFVKRFGFVVDPDSEGELDELDKLMLAKAEDEQRLRNIERAKAANEKRAEKFYNRLEHPLPPRLNTGEPGLIEEPIDEGDDDA